MFGGYQDNDEDDQADQQYHMPPAGAPAGILGQMMAMAGGPGAATWGAQQHANHAPPRAYDEYMKAYSVAMLPGAQRDYLSYGGKIIMPQSALTHLTQLDIESPWNFLLRNPSNPAASTHAGVLEFIAPEGVVHLPFWMMKTLRLNEGDPIRITGARLPPGKLVKVQAQSMEFTEISDPKAVLEQAFRNFSVLTQGDMIEIVYNSLVFELLILETQPAGEGISLLNVDLEVDFATPKGYVEPPRPVPAPVATMASKLKIDVNSSTPGSSRPGSALSNRGAGGTGPAPGPGEFESFKGGGQTLSGRKTKGKGKSVRKIEEADPDSKIIRTDKPRMATNDTLDDARPVPAPLRLPHGKLFFGYPIVPFKREGESGDAATSDSSAPPTQPPSNFSGSGSTLSGRAPRAPAAPRPTASPAPVVTPPKEPPKWGGQGQTVGGRRRAPSPDVIEIDSD